MEATPVDLLWAEGINCQLLLHLVLDEYFPHLSWIPKEWRSSELFAEQLALHIVEDLTHIQPGDICFLGRSEWQPLPDSKNQDAQKLHLAVVLLPGPDPQVIHASYYRGQKGDCVQVEALSCLQQAPQYQKLFAIKRIQPAPKLTTLEWQLLLAGVDEA